MNMKVNICDVTIVERAVEIPEACPKCGTDLTKPNTLVLWEYQDQKRHGHLLPSSAQAVSPESTREPEDCLMINEDESPEGGEGFISYIDIHCACCEYELAGSEESRLTPSVIGHF